MMWSAISRGGREVMLVHALNRAPLSTSLVMLKGHPSTRLRILLQEGCMRRPGSDKGRLIAVGQRRVAIYRLAVC